jgi:hypothetical protein
MTRCDGSRTPSSWHRLLPESTTGSAPAPQAQQRGELLALPAGVNASRPGPIGLSWPTYRAAKRLGYACRRPARADGDCGLAERPALGGPLGRRSVST